MRMRITILMSMRVAAGRTKNTGGIIDTTGYRLQYQRTTITETGA